MPRKTTVAALLTLRRSVVSILKRRTEELDLSHLHREKREEREEKVKAARIPVHPDQMPAPLRRVPEEPVHREERNAAKNGKLKIPANGETSANFGMLLLASFMLREVANQEMRVNSHTEMAPQTPRRTTNPQQDLLSDYLPTAYRRI